MLMIVYWVRLGLLDYLGPIWLIFASRARTTVFHIIWYKARFQYKLESDI